LGGGPVSAGRRDGGTEGPRAVGGVARRDAVPGTWQGEASADIDPRERDEPGAAARGAQKRLGGGWSYGRGAAVAITNGPTRRGEAGGGFGALCQSGGSGRRAGPGAFDVVS